jgi:hypothetical protein
VLSILKKGDFFGEMALLQGGKRTAVSHRGAKSASGHARSHIVQQPVPEECESAGVLYPSALQARSEREQGRCRPQVIDGHQRGFGTCESAGQVDAVDSAGGSPL